MIGWGLSSDIPTLQVVLNPRGQPSPSCFCASSSGYRHSCLITQPSTQCALCPILDGWLIQTHLGTIPVLRPYCSRHGPFTGSGYRKSYLCKRCVSKSAGDALYCESKIVIDSSLQSAGDGAQLLILTEAEDVQRKPSAHYAPSLITSYSETRGLQVSYCVARVVWQSVGGPRRPCRPGSSLNPVSSSRNCFSIRASSENVVKLVFELDPTLHQCSASENVSLAIPE
jgi:hypothetical protein